MNLRPEEISSVIKEQIKNYAAKLETSERTARRRFKYTETITLGELFAFCELYDKDPAELLKQAASASAKASA